MYRVFIWRREGKVARKGVSPISQTKLLQDLTYGNNRSTRNLKLTGVSPSSERLVESWIIVEGYARTAYKGHAGGLYWHTGEVQPGADD